VERSEKAGKISVKLTSKRSMLNPGFSGYLLVFVVLLLPLLACATVNPAYQHNNEVRQAVFAYERERRGPVKDLVIHFRRDEPRINFGGQSQNGGHSVWLYPAGAAEYFATRPQEATYLYIQEIQYNEDGNAATVKVYRGDGSWYQGWQLRVAREAAGRWSVTGEVEIKGKEIE
jgi:hypothetical protein